MPPAGAEALPSHPAPATVAAGADRPRPPVAAAVLPHPPLLVPELAGGAAGELDSLRVACRQALSTVLDAADLMLVVGGGPVWAVPRPFAPGSFRPYGVDVEVTLPAQVGLELSGLPAPDLVDELPLPLAVAAQLLTGADVPPGRVFAATVPTSLGPGAAAAIGEALVAGASTRPGGDPAGGRIGLVVMGDLSARRTDRAPGAFRAEAATFDASVAEALRTGRPERLLDLDPAQAAELLVAGRVPLQVLAGAYGGGPPMPGRILYDDAPYGVGYLVAVLTAP